MKNITVSVGEETHRLARIRAVELGASVSAPVRGYLSVNSPVSVNEDYPLGNILFELSHTENGWFNAVFKKIQEWRNELNR